MGVPHGEREQVHLETRPAWRAWLAEHHRTSTGVWLVSWKAATGLPRMTYDESVEEALCFGWIDSKPGTVDAQRSRLWFAPRKAGSAWSARNKERIERLEAAGLMTEAGLYAVRIAKRDGSWARLDEVEAMVVPADLAAAFDAHPGAREHWEGFPRSTKRAILEWIVQAKRPETRQARIEDTAAKAQRGERANQWTRR